MDGLGAAREGSCRGVTTRAFAPTDAELSPGRALELSDDESRYVARVRRLGPGDVVELLDGRGGAWSTQVLAGGGRRTRLELIERLPDPPPQPERVVLLGLPDAAATLEALVGASELGATQVVLLRCARSQGRLPPPGRTERVLRAAQRQCGRRRPPELIGADAAGPLDLAAAVAHRSELPGYFAWAALRHGPGAALRRGHGPGAALRRDDEAGPPLVPTTGLRLLVGPEGGLAAGEVEQLHAAGFASVRLGPHVLRTPTAVIALLARTWTA